MFGSLRDAQGNFPHGRVVMFSNLNTQIFYVGAVKDIVGIDLGVRLFQIKLTHNGVFQFYLAIYHTLPSEQLPIIFSYSPQNCFVLILKLLI